MICRSLAKLDIYSNVTERFRTVHNHFARPLASDSFLVFFRSTDADDDKIFCRTTVRALTAWPHIHGCMLHNKPRKIRAPARRPSVARRFRSTAVTIFFIRHFFIAILFVFFSFLEHRCKAVVLYLCLPHMSTSRGYTIYYYVYNTNNYNLELDVPLVRLGRRIIVQTFLARSSIQM